MLDRCFAQTRRQEEDCNRDPLRPMIIHQSNQAKFSETQSIIAKFPWANFIAAVNLVSRVLLRHNLINSELILGTRAPRVISKLG